MNLIVICSDYPVIKGNAEFNLLKIQLSAIESNFKEIFLLPTGLKNSQLKNSNSEHAIFSDFRSLKANSFIFFGFYFLKNINCLFQEIKNISGKKTLLNFWISIIAYIKGIYSLTFLKVCLRKNKIDPSKLLIYSFWFNDYILGALFLKKQFPNCKVISGAHGHDLYSDRHLAKRIPFREKAMELIDYVFTDSNEGECYLKKNNPEFISKISTLNSGVDQKKFETKSSKDGIFRIITLSRTHPVKRIDYLLKTLKKLESVSDFQIHYFHIGGGKELKYLEELKDKLNFKFFKINFKGIISDNESRVFFKEHPIDAFLNVSDSEGTPMALIEGLSYTIPAIVTNVGGNRKIGKYCKTLLPIMFTPDELFRILEKIHKEEKYRKQLKALSYNYWEKFHNIEKTDDEIRGLFLRFIQI